MTPRKILLDIPSLASYQRLMLRGVVNYWKRHAPGWRFASTPRVRLSRAKSIRSLAGVDGIISHAPDEESMQAIKAAGAPVVWIEQDPDDPRYATFPIVNADNEAIARLAFAHLRDKGLRRFTFSSTNAWDAWPMRPRRLAFEAAVREAGLAAVPSFAVALHTTDTHPKSIEALQQWVVALPKPIGVFCPDIAEAWRVVEICNLSGIHVPDEVAVLGCDKDELACELTHPPLSTIDHAMEAAGYEAASLLQRLMDGDPPPAAPIQIPPVGVIERQSSETLAIEDVNVREAVRFIRKAAVNGITPSDVVNEVLIGRRRLEMCFKKIVGRTIQEQIMYERVEHARRLLIDTELTLAEIGRRCGFNHESQISAVFARIVGMPPSVYRRGAQK